MRPIQSFQQLLRVILIISFLAFVSISLLAQKSKKQKAPEIIVMTSSSTDHQLEIAFTKGKGHNHPTFAIWVEDLEGNLIETLFVTQYFAKGIFRYADANDGTWKNEAGESLRPAALPYWSHKRNIVSRDSLYVPTPESSVPDAITGATPEGSFILRTSMSKQEIGSFRILMEINQTWDWNAYWTNNKYPNDKDYKSSAQPSVVYEASISNGSSQKSYEMIPVGHGHYSGDDGKLYQDLSTITTALEIAESITVTIN
jgi:hypothetical protein